MNRLFAVNPLLAVAAALAMALILACGGDGGRETSSPGSPDSLLQLVPGNADRFTFADLERVRDERLDDLEEQLAELIGEDWLDEWEIDLDDAESALIADAFSLRGDTLTILRGQFDVEDVEDALDDGGFRDDDYRGVAVWSEGRGRIALALVGEDVIVIGEEERIEEAIEVYVDEGRSMDRDDEAGAVVEALEDAIVYSVAGDCAYRGCRRQGSAVRAEDGDLTAVFAFLFRDDDAAVDAEGDIEDDLEELVDDPKTEADGELVIAESPVDEEQVTVPRDFAALAFRLDEESLAVAAPASGRDREEASAPATQAPARPGDDHGDDAGAATRIRVGETLDGEIDNRDDGDFFYFGAERGVWYSIETHLRSNPDTILFLHGPNEDFLAEDNDSGDSGASLLEWVAPSSDTYYIEVYGFDGATGSYRLSLSESTPAAVASTAAPAPTQAPFTGDDHPDGISGAVPLIREGEYLNGNIERSDDRDFFSFRAERGRKYVIEASLLSNPDTVLVLWGPDGGYITEDDDSGDGGGSRLVWTARSSDTYYIEVKGFDDAVTGTYELSLIDREVLATWTPSPTEAPAAPAPTAARPALPLYYINVGEILELDIIDERPSVSFFDAVRGSQYAIETHLGSISDTVLRLTGPGGVRLEDDDSGDGAASRLTWTASESGQYYIEVQGYGGATGSYRLSLNEVAVAGAAPRGGARYGGELRLALAEEPFEDGFSPRDNFSAGASQIYSLIFSRLWRISPEGLWEFVGDLVEWWELSEDGRERTLGLRQDARFHDGSWVTARDAEYTIEAFSLVDFAGVSVIDDYTLRVEFEEPNIDFPNTMASSWRAIVVPRDLLDAPIGRFTDLVGSGPFIPAQYDRNGVSVLKRNPNYYEDGLPYLVFGQVGIVSERVV